MIGLLARAAVAIGVPDHLKRVAAWAALGLALAIIAGVVAWRVYTHISDTGAAKATAKFEKRDDDRRAEIRVDESVAQDVAGAIGADVAHQTDVVTAQATATEKEIHDAFDAIPAPVAGALPPPAPVDELRAAINAGTERANRAAETADARR